MITVSMDYAQAHLLQEAAEEWQDALKAMSHDPESQDKAEELCAIIALLGQAIDND